MKHSFRKGLGIIWLLTGGVLLTSLYLQYTEALLPCPLCLMQRGMTVLIFVLALIGCFVTKPFRKRLTLGALLLFTIGGIFFALRQLWLQSLPPTDTGMCLPGIEMLVHKLPWHEVVHAFVWGERTGCGEVAWTFLGFSMAAWSLLYFCLIGILSVILGVKLRRDEHV
ncbi:MAG: disulfide bond formation protein B [Legionellaceae bacterium]|nr:disulfide bond formation protein B [Legionellaceae bacterium]